MSIPVFRVICFDVSFISSSADACTWFHIANIFLHSSSRRFLNCPASRSSRSSRSPWRKSGRAFLRMFICTCQTQIITFDDGNTCESIIFIDNNRQGYRSPANSEEQTDCDQRPQNRTQRENLCLRQSVRAFCSG